MKLPTLIIAIVLSSGFFNLFSQTKTELRELYDDAEYFFIREDYNEAVYYYVQLLKYDPQNANLNYKAGACLLKIPGQETKAIPFLRKAVKDISANYNKRSFNERSAPLHSMYYLGNAYRINNQIDEALEQYNKFINSPDFYSNYNERIVREEIKSCERAKIIKDHPIELNEINLGEKINTKTANYSAVVSGNEQVLVFITTLKFYEGMFYCKKTEYGWSEPENINAQVVSDGDMFPTGLSYDGREMLLVKKSDVNNDIYYSRWIDGLWSKAELLSENINSRFNEDFASFSKDGSVIYFTSDRKGGQGGFDIYYSEKSGNIWGEAKNMGEVVNSPFNEASPFLTEDETKLYFSSDGHFNMGGYDIFYSELKNNVWETPVNAGFPLNTTSDNKFFVPIRNGKAGYMSLFREDGFGDLDIYKIVIGNDSTMKSDEVKKSLEKIDQENSIMLKLINENYNDTTIIWFNKNTNRFYFDVPKGIKVIFEE